MRSFILSQCKVLRLGVIWEDLGALTTVRASSVYSRHVSGGGEFPSPWKLKIPRKFSKYWSVRLRLGKAESTVWVKKSPLRGTDFFNFFHKPLQIFNRFLHTYYTFLSTLDYKFVFNYPRFWRSYAILSATTKFTRYAQNVHHRPKRMRCLRKTLIALLIIVCGKSL